MTRRLHRFTGAVVAGVCLLASQAAAQGSGDGFLFRPPHGTIAIRGGFDHASAGSDVFKFVTDELTVKPRDFSSATVVFEFAYRVTPRVDVLFNVGQSRTTIASEFRDWLDNNDKPIEQTTQFQRVPITASVRAYLAQPGRSVGHFAWIPRRVAPYVGGGGGVIWYEFNQSGDFIDFQTLKVFYDRFDSDGWAPSVHAFGGVELSLTPRLAVTTEGRFQWARAPLSRDFSGFDRIDLSGFTIASGILVRY